MDRDYQESPETDERRLLRLSEAAALYGLPERSLRAAALRGALVTYRVFGRLRVRIPDLEDWLSGLRNDKWRSLGASARECAGWAGTPDKH